ncbi:hypothetical protein LshimejAT787_1900820 [Lyophyllum shimeji]|uniref:Uncharacterized protein n=1 Tax=Lyophyllum shimeji TaxID=47721 RepID=A0A9P3Q0M8_LYOSH|nr:hypothetical protein LshimejAT787_1900820 [Lyophyllum shimeji]
MSIIYFGLSSMGFPFSHCIGFTLSYSPDEGPFTRNFSYMDCFCININIPPACQIMVCTSLSRSLLLLRRVEGLLKLSVIDWGTHGSAADQLKGEVITEALRLCIQARISQLELLNTVA